MFVDASFDVFYNTCWCDTALNAIKLFNIQMKTSPQAKPHSKQKCQNVNKYILNLLKIVLIKKEFSPPNKHGTEKTSYVGDWWQHCTINTSRFSRQCTDTFIAKIASSMIASHLLVTRLYIPSWTSKIQSLLMTKIGSFEFDEYFIGPPGGVCQTLWLSIHLMIWRQPCQIKRWLLAIKGSSKPQIFV